MFFIEGDEKVMEKLCPIAPLRTFIQQRCVCNELVIAKEQSHRFVEGGNRCAPGLGDKIRTLQ